MICLPLHEARNRLTAIVHEVEAGKTIRLTRHGKSVAVLLGMEAWTQFGTAGTGFSQRYERFLKTWLPGDTDVSRIDDSEVDDLLNGLRSDEPGRVVEL